MININPSQAFVVQIVERGSPEDTLELRRSNEMIMLTCSEYMVFDMRTPSERARIPAQKVAEEMYNATIERFGVRVRKYIEDGNEYVLRALLSSTAPNYYTKMIQEFLKSTSGGENAGHKKIEI